MNNLGKNIRSYNGKITLVIGIILLVLGIFFNEGMIRSFFCKGIGLEPADRMTIITFEIAAIVIGLVMIFGRNKAVQYYSEGVVAISSAIMILILANFIFFLLFIAKDTAAKTSNPIFQKYGADAVRKAYPALDKDDVNLLLYETWSRPLVYDPYRQFKEAPYSGKFVNIDSSGFRVSRNQGPWPPDRDKYFTVFVFGGSTSFGYGVADSDTIASYLQEFLSAAHINKPVKVYNFGCGCYYSTQERILFEQLILKGYIPDIAIFIDGFNESLGAIDEPEYTARLRQFMKGEWGPNIRFMSERLPLVRGIHSATNMIFGMLFKERENSYYGKSGETVASDKPMVMKSIEHYVRNKKMIESMAYSYKIKPVFVWQPVPTYKYDIKDNLFWNESYKDPFIRSGYPEMDKFVRHNAMGDDFLWCADIQDGIKQLLYVDKFHYSADMSGLFAKKIVDMMKERGLI